MLHPLALGPARARGRARISSVRRRSSATCRSSRAPPAPRGSSTWPPTRTAPCAACRCSSSTAVRCTRAWRSRRSFAPRGETAVTLESAAGAARRLQVAGREIPIDGHGNMLVRFRGAGHGYDYLSAAAVLEGRVPAAALAGRIAFVGTTAAGLKELRATPFDPVYPGPEVHAAALDTLLQGDFLQRPRAAHGWELLDGALRRGAGDPRPLALGGDRRAAAAARRLSGPLGRVVLALLTGRPVHLPADPPVGARRRPSPCSPSCASARASARRPSSRASSPLTQDVIIQSMAALAETRDSETGGHIQRTRHYVKLLAELLREPPALSRFPRRPDDRAAVQARAAARHRQGRRARPRPAQARTG